MKELPPQPSSFSHPCSRSHSSSHFINDFVLLNSIMGLNAPACRRYVAVHYRLRQKCTVSLSERGSTAFAKAGWDFWGDILEYPYYHLRTTASSPLLSTQAPIPKSPFSSAGLDIGPTREVQRIWTSNPETGSFRNLEVTNRLFRRSQYNQRRVLGELSVAKNIHVVAE